MVKRSILSFFVLFTLICVPVSASAFSISQWFSTHHINPTAVPFASSNEATLIDNIIARTRGLSPQVLQLALTAYKKLRAKGLDNQQILTIVDYSRPSTEPRLWVINLKTLEIPVNTLVAHGKNSGDNFSEMFSNSPSSLKSSIGVYLTGQPYVGKHGYALRLDGLEPGFNSNALSRDIVLHSAQYVSDTFAKLHGRLGRSWGCFAVNPGITSNIISQIKGGTVLFAYYPDENWLRHSAYLQA